MFRCTFSVIRFPAVNNHDSRRSQRVIELVKRIARETDRKRLAVLIEDLNGLIHSKVKELRESEIRLKIELTAAI